MKDELTFKIRPDWQEIERVNTETHEFLSATSLPESAVDTYTMIICELLENGIKYGRKDEIMEVMVSISEHQVSIRVANKVDRADYPHLQALDRTLQRIRGVQNPYQAYLERVGEISREPLGEARSCLGLVRIAYEGNASLDFILEDDDTLNVSAVSRLTRAANSSSHRPESGQ
jgi:hypothetical protein